LPPVRFSTPEAEGRVYPLALLTQDHTIALHGNTTRDALIEIKTAAGNARRLLSLSGSPPMLSSTDIQRSTPPHRGVQASGWLWSTNTLAPRPKSTTARGVRSAMACAMH